MSHSKLTKRQNEILGLIESHMAKTGSPPTRAEIAKTMGFRSPNAAEDHLRALARKGVIELVPGTSRGIRLTKESGIPIIKRGLPKLPLLADENIEGNCRLDKGIFRPNISFLFHVQSDEFQSHNIQSGDYVAVHQTDKIQNGQLALLRFNNEITIRRYTPDIERQRPMIEGLLVGVIRSLTNAGLS